jgi:hypothetical protein
VPHGFVLTAANGGKYFDIEYPGATQTQSEKINDKNQLSGGYVDANGVTHGFGADPAKNKYLSVDYPNSIATVTRGINNADDFAGHYTDTNGVRHGFLAEPQ